MSGRRGCLTPLLHQHQPLTLAEPYDIPSLRAGGHRAPAAMATRTNLAPAARGTLERLPTTGASHDGPLHLVRGTRSGRRPAGHRRAGSRSRHQAVVPAGHRTPPATRAADVTTPRANGRPYRRARAVTLAASTLCWLCGHEGATTVDHVTPRSKGGAVADPANLEPAHGVTGCPTCGRRCNQERGANDGSSLTRMPTSR